MSLQNPFILGSCHFQQSFFSLKNGILLGVGGYLRAVFHVTAIAAVGSEDHVVVGWTEWGFMVIVRRRIRKERKRGFPCSDLGCDDGTTTTVLEQIHGGLILCTVYGFGWIGKIVTVTGLLFLSITPVYLI